MLSERENISIAELAVYLVFIIPAVYVCIRHGFFRQLGWVYLVIFCILRIAGGIMGILYAKHPTSREDAIWSAILGSIGLSPLLLTVLGLLERLNGFLKGKQRVLKVLRLLHLPIILGLIMAIVGGTKLSSTDPSKQSSGQSFRKAGVILFLICYVAIFGVAVLTMGQFQNIPRGEKQILYAVLAALPLLAIRLLYSILSVFANNDTFNILDGNATVQFFMAVIEEMFITTFLLAAGLTAPR